MASNIHRINLSAAWTIVDSLGGKRCVNLDQLQANEQPIRLRRNLNRPTNLGADYRLLFVVSGVTVHSFSFNNETISAENDEGTENHRFDITDRIHVINQLELEVRKMPTDSESFSAWLEIIGT